MPRRSLRLLLPACAVVAIGACSSGKDAPPPRPAPIGAANEVSSASPLAEGQYRFLYDAWGTEALDEWPPAAFMLSLMKSEPDVFGAQFAKFGFLRDPNDELPIGFKRGLVDSSKVQETCALCHVARLPDGRVWLGAPNEHLDLARFQLEVDRRWVAAGHPSSKSALELAKLARFGPGRTAAESSSYPKPVPADFPAYFQLGKRSHLNYLGTGRDVRSEAFLSIYTFGAGNPNDAVARVKFPDEVRVRAFLDFFGAIAAPVGPAQEPSLVDAGRAVFAKASCVGCHHVDDLSLDDVTTLDTPPDAHERLPGADPAFPRGSVRTDPLHRVIQDTSSGGGDRGFDDLLAFIIKHGLKASGTDGYRATPLLGVWATAPYLHDGSVPTLEDLLAPETERPKSWDHDGFTVDTTIEGNGNGGHEFGTTLPAADKTALLAYLRSL
ncbi:MAG: hypothetical protein NVSMB47_15280 [Polyangiales bacterium]